MLSNFFTTELGLAGLVVSGLMSLMAYVIYSGNKKESSRVDSFQRAMGEFHSMHKEEREEWRRDADRRDDSWRNEITRRDREISTALTSLRDVIQEVSCVKNSKEEY